MPVRETYDISVQLAHWMQIRKKTDMDVARFLFPGSGRDNVQKILSGERKVRYAVIKNLSVFFRTSVNKFYGRDVYCGMEKALEILNEEGDYLGGDGPMVRIGQREWQLEVAEQMARKHYDSESNEKGCGR